MTILPIIFSRNRFSAVSFGCGVLRAGLLSIKYRVIENIENILKWKDEMS